MDTITGTAAGVPFTALPPANGAEDAPLIVSWHMLDAPRTDAAFAAALPMTEVPAWRVHLGMPMFGARMVDGRPDAALELARRDAVLAFFAPIVHQAAEEFPGALAALREQLSIGEGPIGVLGGSLGGNVALKVLTQHAPITAVALVNPAVRLRSAVDLLDPEYQWTDEAHRAADALDFPAHVDDFASRPPLLLISGEHDHPALRTDATEFVTALRERHPNPQDVELTTVPELAHPLADEPGLEPAPQWAVTRVVDDILGRWFRQRLAVD